MEGFQYLEGLTRKERVMGYQPSLLTPLLWFEETDLVQANGWLREWGHAMGPLRRPIGRDRAHVLMHREDGPQVVLTTSPLVRETVAGGVQGFDRSNTIELSRLCAKRSGLCRVGIRLWREFVFPEQGARWAVSYQDADMHSGATYRFDGWKRLPELARSGVDSRSGRKGRRKWVWVWPDVPSPEGDGFL